MERLLCEDLSKTIQRLARKSSNKRAAVAYVTSDDIVAFGNGDTLVTDATDGAIAAGQTNAHVLDRALKRGADVYSLANLHSKVVLLDRHVVIGSANLSRSSSESLIEAAWITDDPAALGMATSLIAELTEGATLVDRQFVKRILRIPVVAKDRKRRRSRNRKRIRILKSRTWIVGMYELKKEYPDEIDATASGKKRSDGEPHKRE